MHLKFAISLESYQETIKKKSHKNSLTSIQNILVKNKKDDLEPWFPYGEAELPFHLSLCGE